MDPTNMNNPAAGATPAPAAPPAPPAAPPPAPAAPPVTAAADTDNGEGGGSKIEWVPLALIILAGSALVIKMYYYRQQIKQIARDDKKINTEIAELRHNLKTVMKDSYETMA